MTQDLPKAQWGAKGSLGDVEYLGFKSTRYSLVSRIHCTPGMATSTLSGRMESGRADV